MSAVDNGGPAFPAPDLGEMEFAQRSVYPGMSLRDYFAGQAMGCFFARNRQREPITSPDQVAAGAYELADAMLKARAS